MSASASDRLFALLPQFVRAADERQPLEPLRTLYGVLQHAYDEIEREVAGLYDDWFIETCAPEAVARIASLVGLDLGRTAPLWSHRAQAANTLRWRGRPGTLATLAQAAACASGWPAVALDLGAEVAMSAAIGPAPGAAAIARIPSRGADGPAERSQRSVSVSPSPPVRGQAAGPAYAVPGAVSLGVFTLPVFLVEGVQPAPCGAVFAFRPDGLPGPLYVAPEVFAPAMSDPGVEGLPLPLTRPLLRDRLAAGSRRLPLAIRRRLGDGWAPVQATRIGVARLDRDSTPTEGDADVLVDPERGLFVFASRDDRPGAADLRVDFTFGFGGLVGAAAWSPREDAPPAAPVRRVCLAARPTAPSQGDALRPDAWATSLDEALAGWDGGTDLDVRIVDGGRYAAPQAIPRLREGVLLQISAAPGAKPGLDGTLSIGGARARVELEGLDLPDGVDVRGASLSILGCTIGLATPRAIRVDCGWASGHLRIRDSIVGPVVCDAARFRAERSIFDGRPALETSGKISAMSALAGIAGPSPAAARLDHCTVLGDLDLDRPPELEGCAIRGTLRDGEGSRRLRARFVTLAPNDPRYLQLSPDDPSHAEHGAFGLQDRACRLQALDAAIAAHLPQGLACAVVLAS